VKVGAENRNKLIAAVVLMLLAAVLVGRTLFSSGPIPTPAPVVATSAAPTPVAKRTSSAPRARATGTKSASRKGPSAPRSIDPSLRKDWLKASEDTKYEGNGRNIFLAQAEIPKPQGPGPTDAKKNEPPPGPPPPPPPPPINLKFYGFASKPGEPKKVFLSQGEDVFIAGEGEIVDRRYKVLHISPTSVEIEDMLSNNRQNIPLTQG
jgi:hypothetical protein